MKTQTREIMAAAIKLSKKERTALVDKLLQSLAAEGAESSEDLWLAELERRSNELRSGKVRGIPWSQVKRKLQRSNRAKI